MSMLSKILLWLFVVNLGVVFGAGIYEARISVPRWVSVSEAGHLAWHPREARRDDTGRRFWGLTTTGPLTLLVLGNLWAAWLSVEPVRVWWLAACIAALADRLFTFCYFIPSMVQLLGSEDSEQARTQARRWAQLNYFRQLLVLIAWLAALQTFALLHAHR